MGNVPFLRHPKEGAVWRKGATLDKTDGKGAREMGAVSVIGRDSMRGGEGK